MTRVLKLPAYRRLLGAYSLNELALAIGSLALAFLVYRQTGSAIGAAGFFLCAQFVPAFLAPMLVAQLDQLPPRGVLALLYVAEGLAYLALASVVKSFSLAPVLALALLDGVLAVTARSLARATTVAVTARVGLLREANALTNGAFSICFMAGPAIGGALVVIVGTRGALLTNAGLFALIALTLVTAPGLPGPEGERVPAAGRVRAALGHARDHPGIRALLTLQAAGLLFFTISIPVEVVYAQHSLHAGADGYGALLASWGAGAVGGAAVYARWRQWPARDLIAAGAAALGIGFIVMALAPSLAVAIVGAVIAGVGNGIEAVAVRTAVQEEVEPSWMALMMSLNESVAQATPGAGIILGGAIAALASPRAALAAGGVGSLAITVVTWVVLAPSSFELRPREEQPAGAGRRAEAPARSTARR